MDKINTLLSELETLKPDLCGKDFLLTWENSLDTLKAVMLTAENCKVCIGRKNPGGFLIMV